MFLISGLHQLRPPRQHQAVAGVRVLAGDQPPRELRTVID